MKVILRRHLFVDPIYNPIDLHATIIAGIPVAQQNLIFNNRELSDELEMKDIPLVKGSRLKFVLGMKGGPVSARRVVSMPDYDNWLDLNDILNSSRYIIGKKSIRSQLL